MCIKPILWYSNRFGSGLVFPMGLIHTLAIWSMRQFIILMDNNKIVRRNMHAEIFTQIA